MLTGSNLSAQSKGSGKVSVIVLAAGQSTRTGSLDKILSPLLNRPLISYSMQTFNNSPDVTSIVLVMASERLEIARRLVKENKWTKVTNICVGGERRQDSVRLALECMEMSEWVIIHDGARPCVDTNLIRQSLAEAIETGACAAAVPVTDTIKYAGSDMVVKETIDRRLLWAVQTPQVFRTELLRRAHQQVSDEVTDDASMVERIGVPVRLFLGSYNNVKITTKEDFAVAETILRSKLDRKVTAHL